MAREENISLNKMEKGNAKWSTNKAVLGWEIDTSQQILTLPSTCRGKLAGGLAAIPNQAARVSKKKYYILLGVLCSAVPEIAGAGGMFSSLQHALKTADARRVKLTFHVHNALNLW